MATKTISIDMEAYRRLRRARLRPEESFSQVIRRAAWGTQGHTAAEFLVAMDTCPVMDDASLRRLDEAQERDRPLVTRNAEKFRRVPGLRVVGY